MKLTDRKNQLWLLIILSATTMIITYYIQGALSSGKSPTSINNLIWQSDHITWAIRAIIEGVVIAYIASTSTSNKRDSKILWMLKIVLITLISLTVGPVILAGMNSIPLKDVLSDYKQFSWSEWLWSFGLASYIPLMLLGASFAYKVQPNDNSSQLIVNGEYEQLQSTVNEFEETVNRLQSTVNGLNETNNKLQSDINTLLIERQAIDAWIELPATVQSSLIYRYTNGDRPSIKDVAELLGCSQSTVNNGYRKAREDNDEKS